MNRQQFPPGGWQYHQAQTGWNAPAPVSNTFDQTVVNIIKHRQANSAMTIKHKLSTNMAQVGIELEAFNARRLGYPDPKPLPPPAVPMLSGAVVAAVADVKKLAAGNALLLEWQESGEPPVPIEIAIKRAEVCVACPKNDARGLSQYFTVPIAENIRRKLEKLHDMKLETPSDEKLQVCSACLCPLKLKVHTPLHLIVKRLKPEQRSELHPACWILSEH